MLWKRLLSAIVVIPVLILIIHWGSSFYPVLLGVVVAIMLVEFHELARAIGSKGHKVTLFLSAVPFCLSAQLGFSVALAIALSLVIPFASEIFRRQVGDVFLSVSSTITGSIYVGWAFGYHLLLLRQIDGQVGSSLVFFLLATVWCGDSGAYLIGSTLGKRKLCPAISPNKTIEGAVAGLITGTAGGFAVWFLLMRESVDVVHVPILGLSLGIISQISDLSESIIKRNAQVKDSSSAVPGHGGLLDRCDGLIFSSPALYYYFEHFMDST
ncbi:MAG: phosphatidate cytidylyltransferase [Candidatus Poribacteria bacterium]|nr:phosphatidate cytidylyltransferase [Candidatus Poribacteria bacterium]MDE0504051.1 phosphatidate cytidylyltransferase [Candidatus Poribacteria bacterium]